MYFIIFNFQLPSVRQIYKSTLLSSSASNPSSLIGRWFPFLSNDRLLFWRHEMRRNLSKENLLKDDPNLLIHLWTIIRDHKIYPGSIMFKKGIVWIWKWNILIKKSINNEGSKVDANPIALKSYNYQKWKTSCLVIFKKQIYK